MIVELRSYRLRPGTFDSVEQKYAEAMPARTKFSRLGGFWRTVIGPMDKIIHAWPYADLAERSQVRTDSMKAGDWPPPVVGSLYEQETAIMLAAQFSPPLTAQKIGPYYEFCTDTFAPGAIRKVLPIWKESIAARTKISPLVACWFSELGAMNTVLHIWAYRDLVERERVREEAAKSGAWPIKVPPELAPLKQDSLIAVPLSFSPMQ